MLPHTHNTFHQLCMQRWLLKKDGYEKMTHEPRVIAAAAALSPLAWCALCGHAPAQRPHRQCMGRTKAVFWLRRAQIFGISAPLSILCRPRASEGCCCCSTQYWMCLDLKTPTRIVVASGLALPCFLGYVAYHWRLGSRVSGLWCWLMRWPSPNRVAAARGCVRPLSSWAR